jgi:ferredoxin-NADP reductase
MKTSLFISVGIPLLGTSAFAPALKRISSRSGPTTTRIFAEGGAPQYDKLSAVLRHAEVLGEGSVVLHIDTGDTTIDYQPGHVLALEIQGDNSAEDTLTQKNTEDTQKNGGWMRGPYTVARATENSFDVLIKVVGDKSRRFASAEPGTCVRFGGKFKVPIVEGIQKDNVKRVVLISTGVGVGPCVGAIEKALEDSSFPPIELYASYRTTEEIVYIDHLNNLSAQYPERFVWKAIVSSERGRLSASKENLQAVASSEGYEITDTHYHLIGNAQMVKEFKAGLGKAGVPDEKVTVESYFNSKASVNEDVIDRIAGVISASCCIPSIL